MRRPSHRPERVAERIRHVVGQFLADEARDPRIGFVTVTAVEVSPDFTHAWVRVSVMGDEEEKARSLEGLKSAARAVRARLGGELRLRTVPEVEFQLDRGLEHAQHIDRLLRELKEGGG